MCHIVPESLQIAAHDSAERRTQVEEEEEEEGAEERRMAMTGRWTAGGVHQASLV